MLALIAGRGDLPAAVAAAQSVPVLVTSLAGNHPPDGLHVDITFRIENMGRFLETLSARGVSDVCFCGAITRPKIDPSLIDARTAPLMPALAAAVAGGEDSALRAVMSVFGDAGFTVRGAHDLAPSLLPVAGVLTQTPVPAGLSGHMELATTVLAQQGARDIGQACVIRDGAVIAREDSRGTDAMLDKLAVARTTPKGGVLFKAPKPGQDRRVDLPTIGPDTAMRASQAGLDGIVIAAGGVIVLDQPRVRTILDKMGMYLWVR